MPAVLDEDLPDLPSAENRSGKIEPGDVGLEGLRVVGRNPVLALEPDAAALEKGEIRLVADERKDGVGRDPALPFRGRGADEVRPDLENRRSKVRPDRSRRDSILEVRLDPVLDAFRNRRSADDQRDAGSVAVEVEGGLGRGVLPAHDDDVTAVEGVAGHVARVHMGLILPRQTEAARVGKETCREDRRRGLDPFVAPPRGDGNHHAATRPRLDPLDSRLGTDAHAELLCHSPVVRQRLEARRMRVRRGERNPRDIEKVAGGEPAHLLGKMVDRVEHRAAVQTLRGDASPAELDCASDPGRAGAGDDDGRGKRGHARHSIGRQLQRLDPDRAAARVEPQRVAALAESSREVAARDLAAHREGKIGPNGVAGGLDREVRARIDRHLDAAARGRERAAGRVAAGEAGLDPAARGVGLDVAAGVDDPDAAARRVRLDVAGHPLELDRAAGALRADGALDLDGLDAAARGIRRDAALDLLKGDSASGRLGLDVADDVRDPDAAARGIRANGALDGGDRDSASRGLDRDPGLGGNADLVLHLVARARKPVELVAFDGRDRNDTGALVPAERHELIEVLAAGRHDDMNVRLGGTDEGDLPHVGIEAELSAGGELEGLLDSQLGQGGQGESEGRQSERESGRGTVHGTSSLSPVTHTRNECSRRSYS